MALNSSHVPGGGVLIFNTERILIYYDGVEMAFEMQCNMPHFKGKKYGRVYLTTHRVIFNNKDAKDTLQSFSMPFFTMKELELEQPVFGANYIKGRVKPEPGGNWEGDGRFKMWFNKGGAIEFGQAMLHAGKMASRYSPPQPPVYTPPTAGYYQAPPPAYAPPDGQMYSFVPYQTFPSAPPANSVYMYEAPPPYPGIDPNLTPYPTPGGGVPGYGGPPYPTTTGYPTPGSGVPGYGGPPYPTEAGGAMGYGGAGPSAPPFTANGYPQGCSAAAAKEAEAAASGGNAYYNPAYPHSVYMPPNGVMGDPNGQHLPSAPPAYSEAIKKND